MPGHLLRLVLTVSRYLATTTGISGALKVSKCSDVACLAEYEETTTLDDTGQSGYFSSIAIAADGFPIILYSQTGFSEWGIPFSKLMVVKCKDAACSSGGETINSPNRCFKPC